MSSEELFGIFFKGKSTVTPERIGQFEISLGLSLPKDYVEFLLRTNGQGLQGAHYVAIPGQQVVKFHVFLGLDTVKNLDIEYWNHELCDSLPANCLNIGRDPGGNLFLLSLGEDCGTVSYYDRAEAFPDSNEESGNTYEVARTFTEFVERFRSSIELATIDLEQLAASMPKPNPSMNVTQSIVAPKGKDLSDRLSKLAKSFPTGFFESLAQSVHCGFELSASLEDWNHRNEQFLNERIHKYITEDSDLEKTLVSNPQLKFLYGLLWGYVLGQLAVGECTMQEYASAKATVRKTMPLA